MIVDRGRVVAEAVAGLDHLVLIDASDGPHVHRPASVVRRLHTGRHIRNKPTIPAEHRWLVRCGSGAADGHDAVNTLSRLGSRPAGKHQDAIGEPGLGKLPTDPAKLAKVIHDRKWEGGPAGSGEDFVQVGDLLRLPNASPRLREAAFEVGARIPGVKSLGTRTFHGVTGATIAITSRSRNHDPFYKGSCVTDELTFDRATSTLKAEAYLIIKDGKIIDSGGTTYLTSGLVNSTHSTPGH